MYVRQPVLYHLIEIPMHKFLCIKLNSPWGKADSKDVSPWSIPSEPAHSVSNCTLTWSSPLLLPANYSLEAKEDDSEQWTRAVSLTNKYCLSELAQKDDDTTTWSVTITPQYESGKGFSLTVPVSGEDLENCSSAGGGMMNASSALCTGSFFFSLLALAVLSFQ